MNKYAYVRRSQKTHMSGYQNMKKSCRKTFSEGTPNDNKGRSKDVFSPTRSDAAPNWASASTFRIVAARGAWRPSTFEIGASANLQFVTRNTNLWFLDFVCPNGTLVPKSQTPLQQNLSCKREIWRRGHRAHRSGRARGDEGSFAGTVDGWRY